jgi:CheY-like chemotaxis protein
MPNPDMAPTTPSLPTVAVSFPCPSDITARNHFLMKGFGIRAVQFHSKRPPRLRSMKTLHILIVEDEPLVAMDLEMMVTEIVTAAVVVEASVAATKKVLQEALDFAFLDVDVTNGKTFEVAQILERKHVPFVFISGSPQDQLKPFHAAQIEHALQAVVN